MTLQQVSASQPLPSEAQALPEDLACPFCSEAIGDIGDPSTQGKDAVVVCQRCKRRIHLTRYFWVNKGINIDSRHVLRCPNCFKLFAEGEFSDKPQRIKCRDCGRFSIFQRIA